MTGKADDSFRLPRSEIGFTCIPPEQDPGLRGYTTACHLYYFVLYNGKEGTGNALIDWQCLGSITA